jgi:hypothetical protein
MKSLAVVCFVWALSTSFSAQWLNYPAPGIPRLADGKPDLSAPAPRTADGKPELDGIWFPPEGPLNEFGRRTARGTFEIKPEDIILTPEGEAWQRQHRESQFLNEHCLPDNLSMRVRFDPIKVVTFKGVIVILYELGTSYRQIFVDGRGLPKDPNPTWSGYSVGRWDGDTLVVDTTGFNDAETIVPGPRPHSDALHMIERFRRQDFGHLEIQLTIDDPKVYAKPWTITHNLHLNPDTELLEHICNENEKDLRHIVVK